MSDEFIATVRKGISNMPIYGIYLVIPAHDELCSLFTELGAR